jgi:hypothetical protein
MGSSVVRGSLISVIITVLVFVPIVKHHHVVGYRQVSKAAHTETMRCEPGAPSWDPHSRTCITPTTVTEKEYTKPTVKICTAQQVWLHGRCEKRGR